MAEIYVIDSEWEVCDNCEYWHREDKSEWGRCQQEPPQGFVIGKQIQWLFPKMHATAGCGAFHRRAIGRVPIQIEGEADGVD